MNMRKVWEWFAQGVLLIILAELLQSGIVEASEIISFGFLMIMVTIFPFTLKEWDFVIRGILLLFLGVLLHFKLLDAKDIAFFGESMVLIIIFSLLLFVLIPSWVKWIKHKNSSSK